ncbi:MAG: hypothetical protein ABJC66_07650 [Gammaproteobacteria bacterium]
MLPASIAALIACFSSPAVAVSATTAKLDASGLAVVDAAVRFCIGVDPGETPQYKRLKDSLIGDLSDRQQDAMENTADYKQTYSLFSTVLAGAPHAWALASCKNIIVSSGGSKPHPGRDNDDNENRKKHH